MKNVPLLSNHEYCRCTLILSINYHSLKLLRLQNRKQIFINMIPIDYKQPFPFCALFHTIRKGHTLLL